MWNFVSLTLRKEHRLSENAFEQSADKVGL
jgi:hypothetical protein